MGHAPDPGRPQPMHLLTVHRLKILFDSPVGRRCLWKAGAKLRPQRRVTGNETHGREVSSEPSVLSLLVGILAATRPLSEHFPRMSQHIPAAVLGSGTTLGSVTQSRPTSKEVTTTWGPTTKVMRTPPVVAWEVGDREKIPEWLLRQW